MKYDVFNGDADGICALQQMRLVYPADSELVTGVKRDIQLVKNVQAGAGDQVLVLDVSLAKNTEAVRQLLANHCQVRYFDHHLPGEIPQHNLFTYTIDTSADTCTSLLVNDYLNHQYVLWAITGAYGDNMIASAERLANQQALNQQQKTLLRELGVSLNYNGYGASLDDLYFNPADLYRALKPYHSPFEFIEHESVFATLKAGYQSDMAKAADLQPDTMDSQSAVFILPAEKWCRRVSGVLGNHLSNRFPERAHAILIESENNSYQVSVRAPQNNKTAAGQLCSQFESGGGREAAGGINALPEADKVHFIEAFRKQYLK
ncbi:MAG: hypothetical protein OEY29_03575 [Gammaproteobacteria bacterium]|nr:hypothetical protein [Gammaproteobacteria bacterium]